MTRRTELFIVSAVVLIAACVTFVPLRNEWVLHTKSKTTAAKQNVAKGDRARAEIEAFNKKFVDAHLKMDNAAIMNMWAEDGVSLLPATAPMIGRPAIGKFMNDVMAQLKDFHMENISVDFQGIEVNGDWASEWAYEHQTVQAPPGKPVIDSYGKMLLVLHKESDGNWRITREMWNQGLKQP